MATGPVGWPEVADPTFFQRLVRPVGGLLAVLLTVTLVDGAWASSLPDGEWEGRWYPKNSCKDTRERPMTATTKDGHIRGEVINPHGTPGVFAADIKASGSFSATVVGLKRFGFSVKGKASSSEITANWEGRDDCGNGTFVLRLVKSDPAVTKLPEAPAPAPAPQPEIAKQSPSAAPAEPAAPLGEKDTARAALETLHRQGLISEEEYQAKLQALARPQPTIIMAPSDLPPPDPRLAELDDLLTNGAITADEYLQRRRVIIGSGN